MKIEDILFLISSFFLCAFTGILALTDIGASDKELASAAFLGSALIFSLYVRSGRK